MSRRSQILVIILIFSYLFIFSGTDAFAATYPESVRIGLYFGSSSASNVAFDSEKGLEAGYYQNGRFNALIEETGGKQIIVRKDTYFIKSDKGVLEEYNPTEGVPYDGETLGPYHIRIGDKVSNLSSAQSASDKIKKEGVTAYPVFEDGWAVWTGFYGDAARAKEDIKNLKARLNTDNLTVIEPSASRLIVYDGDFKPILVFGSEDYKFTVRPGQSNDPEVLSVNGKRYRGEIELRRYSGSDMTVINVIGLEEYLYGVVPSEIEAYAPLEAVKAQAVAARTYSYLNMGKYNKWGFDMVDTVDSQVYGGYDVERTASNQAVNETKNKKVLYNGKPASLFFFSSSGGMTEDNVNVWGTDIPYLKSVPDPYESGTSYNYNWSRTFDADDIRMKLFLSGVEIGDILSMKAEEYTPAGRVNKLTITGTEDSITYYREDIRKILGDNGSYLPSRMFTINSGNSSGAGSTVVSVISAEGTSDIDVYGTTAISSLGAGDIEADKESVKILGSEGSRILTGEVPAGAYVLTGKGWGHGVGMSQEGAKGLAKNGYTYDKILMYYFKGVTVE